MEAHGEVCVGNWRQLRKSGEIATRGCLYSSSGSSSLGTVGTERRVLGAKGGCVTAVRSDVIEFLDTSPPTTLDPFWVRGLRCSSSSCRDWAGRRGGGQDVNRHKEEVVAEIYATSHRHPQVRNLDRLSRQKSELESGSPQVA